MIRAYADIPHNLLVIAFDYEIDLSLTDADVTQYVMAALAPGSTTPSAYDSITLNQIALDYSWPVFMPAFLSLTYTAGSPGHIYRERRLTTVGTFMVDVVTATPPAPVPDHRGGARSRARDRGNLGGPL